jgi:raffinose/stachyose/melibiose transport system permease protein
MKVFRAQRSTELLAVLWSLPALLFYGIFALVPMAIAVYLSFVSWNGLSALHWAGFANWVQLFHDPVAGHAILLTFGLMILGWVVQTPISLLLGVFMAGAHRYRSVFSFFYFIPLLFSTVAIGMTWSSMLDPNFGMIDILLKAIGLPQLAQGWLGNPNLAFYVVTLVISWQFVPFHALLYQAGARQIPLELYDASQLDGANRINRFFQITLPQLRYTIVTSSTLMLTGSLTYFDLIFVMTQGGPGYATRVLPLDMYISAFQNQQIGYGSTLAVLLAITGILLSVVLLRSTGFTKMSSQLEGL